MKKHFLLLLLIPFISHAQIIDDFSDGDFTQNPPWEGTSDKFIVNNNDQLQLNDNEAGNAWLATPYELEGNIEWRFWISLTFSPSGNNFSEVYLISDSPDLSGPLNGYFLRFGEPLGNDPIELFLQQGDQTTSLARGTEGLVAGSFAMTVRVTRSEAGVWNIYADPDNSGLFQFEATASDNTFQPGGFFGFYCQYTVSNSTNMYYDHVFVIPEQVDEDPPDLLSAMAVDPFTIELFFDEAIDESTAVNTSNYQLDGGIGHPDEAAYGDNAAMIRLQFINPLESGTVYTLSISNLADLSGNVMAHTEVQVSYYEGQPNDVVINEIMADPRPVVGLPDAEYIELYNNTDIPINLDGWKLMIGTGERLLEQVEIAPHGYLLLGHQNDRDELSVFGPYFGFSSFQLANAGASLRLISKEGVEISAVNYTDGWYRDGNKAGGGWSLEQIDPTNPCGAANNWIAAIDPSGGTPGRINSVDAPNALPPQPERFSLETDRIIQVWFDQQMDNSSLSQTNAYTLEPGAVHPVQTTLNPADPQFVELEFGQAFSPNTIFELHFSTSILNCAGIALAADTYITFGIPVLAEAEDIIINEILFNPYSNGKEWVEIYNRSDKVIDLQYIDLARVQQTPPNPPDTVLRAISPHSLMILPQTYKVLTTDAASLIELYETPFPDQIIQMTSFPIYPNAGGTAMLKARYGPVLDVFTYDENMHHPLLNSVKGVSLERIHFDRPADDPTNWHSAAESSGFGTPGYQNSAFADIPEFTAEIVIEPEIFSPDGDGFEDVASIAYSFDQAGYTLNIYIFDASGQQIRHLVKSKLAGQSGTVSWDGRHENGSRVGVGIYVVFAEVFDMDGNVQHYKKPVVVATR